MNNVFLPLIKIETMSSLEIAELTGKNHSHVLRDIREILAELYEVQNPNLDSIDIEGVSVEIAENGMTKQIWLDEEHTLTLVTGYSIRLRRKVVARWRYLEEQLRVVQFRQGTKKHQLNAMEALSHLLPDDLADEALSYIKANTVVNKAVSNLFGFPKMLKKDDMSPDMLSVRERVMDDYLKLYDVLDDNAKVAAIVYEKYQPKRIEAA
ncbi:Rha family transcriptional regulator [Methylomonas rapida]|uniref:Rha family transcriptional regulator n=1 Tax=Methylomonas rapida TaxID=2963939 RepID=A0ABY7GQZ6_9GAMM|nr:Rha family transcriptional regulator [Methylomonas rapida]WAR46942.1 Rha family transcriptional regulator [Methylomonas rapida]